MGQLKLPKSLDTFNALVAVHSEATRHYHDVEHVTRCLDLVDEFRVEIPNASFVELAFWFHDAVYDAQSKTNEADSADWAIRFLKEAGAFEKIIWTVHDLIMATQHMVEPLSLQQQWMADIDLAILGAEPDRFDRYERDIRREYAWVPEAEFNQRRAALLEGFLERGQIFRTDALAARFEVQARKNLQRSISHLRRH